MSRAMHNRRIARRDFLSCLGTSAAVLTTTATAPMAQAVSGPLPGSCLDQGRPSNAAVTGIDADELPLFAFDNHWIPFRHHLTLQLEQPTPHPQNPVLRRGAAGQPDSVFASLYGTVFLQDGKFRMWYGAVDDMKEFSPGRSNMRLAYAESEDGIHWIKPKLGLYSYKGSRDNNLLDINREVYNSPLVLHDPDEADPQQRFKMAFVGYHHKGLPLRPLLCVAFSPDGLRWKCLEDNPVIRTTWAEISGLYRWNGIYYCNGQTTWPASNPKRTMVSFASSDFRSWEQAGAISFHRHPLEPASKENVGPQVHLGASIWHRRSVLLGLYGKWENQDSNGSQLQTRIDLGLIVSNDGLHFREPVPGFRFLPWGSEASSWKTLRLLQAQAFVNHKDKTYIWYGAGSDDTGRGPAVENQAEVGLATLPRDRFGCLRPGSAGATWTSQTLPAMPGGAEIALNIDGLGPGAVIHVELLDAAFSPTPGYSGDKAARLQQSGLRQVVSWADGKSLVTIGHPWRIRARFDGDKSSASRFYCLYVKEQQTPPNS